MVEHLRRCARVANRRAETGQSGAQKHPSASGMASTSREHVDASVSVKSSCELGQAPPTTFSTVSGAFSECKFRFHSRFTQS